MPEKSFSKSGIASKVAALIEPVAEQMGYVLWDVKYQKEGLDMVLAVEIDRVDGEIGMNDCVDFTRAINPVLDSHDPVPDSYSLEVSSAGTERQLKYPRHYDVFLGRPVKVKLFSPSEIEQIKDQKSFQAVLSGYDESVLLFTIEGEEIRIDKSHLASVKAQTEKI